MIEGWRPDCDCHGEPMWWHSYYSIRNGKPRGAWRCGVKDRDRNQRYRDADPIGYNRRVEERRREKRIARMKSDLEEIVAT